MECVQHRGMCIPQLLGYFIYLWCAGQLKAAMLCTDARAEHLLLLQVAITCTNTEKAPYWHAINNLQREELKGLYGVGTVDANGLALQVGAYLSVEYNPSHLCAQCPGLCEGYLIRLCVLDTLPGMMSSFHNNEYYTEPLCRRTPCWSDLISINHCWV